MCLAARLADTVLFFLGPRAMSSHGLRFPTCTRPPQGLCVQKFLHKPTVVPHVMPVHVHGCPRASVDNHRRQRSPWVTMVTHGQSRGLANGHADGLAREHLHGRPWMPMGTPTGIHGYTQGRLLKLPWASPKLQRVRKAYAAAVIVTTTQAETIS